MGDVASSTCCRTRTDLQRCYSRDVRKKDVIAYVRRDWGAIAAMKRRRWAELKAQMSPDDALSVGDVLRHHVQDLRPDWPTEEDRRKDLAFHMRMSEMLGRVKPPRRR